MIDEAIDARLVALLRVPEPAPDPAFIARVARAIEADRLFRAARRRAWRRFAVDGVATAGIAAGVGLVWRTGPLALPAQPMAFGSAAVLPIVLLLWLMVGMRPAVR